MKKHLSPKHAAVIVIDMQNDFCHDDGVMGKAGRNIAGGQKIVPRIEYLIESARKAGIPIIFIQMTQNQHTVSEAWMNKPQHKGVDSMITKKGTWGADFYKLAPQPEDIVIEKHRYSAFIGTQLDQILRSLNRKSIIVTGVSSNTCVESTLRDGFMFDYHVTMVQDASASFDSSLHEGTIRNIGTNFGLVLDTDQIADYWSQS